MEPVPPLPLSTLLSQVLVAHTVELDNEAEHRLPHRTTRQDDPGARHDAPWLVSFVLWANVLRHLDQDPVTVSELRARARTTRLLLGGLRRWGYVTLTPSAGETLQNPPQDSVVVRATRGSRQAEEIFRALPPLIDDRWRTRFGAGAISHLERALRAVFDELMIDPPAYLPVVYPAQNGKAEPALPRATRSGPGASIDGGGLSPLLAGVLLAFTLDFERESRVSLPISANTLRVLGPTGARVRDLPQLTGVSKEANAMCAGWLERHGCARREPDPAVSRGKVLCVTAKGLKAQQKCRRLLAAAEASWRTRYGAVAVDDLRAALEPLVGDGTLASSPLVRGLEPYPDNWRAAVRQTPGTLPHYPMVLHRGGYPDGS
jgi:DNA-binding MarR family transcriptional regulator